MGPSVIIVAGFLGFGYFFYQEINKARLETDKQLQNRLEVAQNQLVQTYEKIGGMSDQLIENIRSLMELNAEIDKDVETSRKELAKLETEGRQALAKLETETREEVREAKEEADEARREAIEVREELTKLSTDLTRRERDAESRIQELSGKRKELDVEIAAPSVMRTFDAVSSIAPPSPVPDASLKRPLPAPEIVKLLPDNEIVKPN